MGISNQFGSWHQVLMHLALLGSKYVLWDEGPEAVSAMVCEEVYLDRDDESDLEIEVRECECER
jgi:hypothetical protein